MFDVSGFFGSLYSRLSRRRYPLFIATVVVLATATALTSRITMDEDLAAMLPDSPEVRQSFNLLQQAPLSRKILINVSARNADGTQRLIEAGDRLAAAMAPPTFSRVVVGPETADEMRMFVWLNRSLPYFFTKQDEARIERELTRDVIKEKAVRAYEELFLPTGSAAAALFQTDPFDLRTLALEKLRFLSLVPNMRLQQNRFVSADGQNLLLFADTGISMTDSAGSRKLIEEFERLKRTVLPGGTDAELLSGHSYAVANADRIKKDLSIVLSVSLVTMFILFLVFLRTWSGLLIFLVPVAVLTLATSAILLVYGKVSAVTIGFASVLLGITDDYPLHIYFAMRKAGQEAGRVVAEVARPVCFSGLTLFGAFGALVLSTLPGQRQIGIFSMAGILGSVALSLIVLPHFVRPAGQTAEPDRRPRTGGRKTKYRTVVLACWLSILTFLFWEGSTVGFDGDIRSLNYVSKEISTTEDRLKRTWGDFRGMAMIGVRGNSIEPVLEANERLLSSLNASERVVSIAPVLPSSSTQKENRQRWDRFWSGEQGKALVHNLIAESEKLGFSKDSFAPFLKSLVPDAYVAPVTIEGLRAAGMGVILDQLILRGEDFSLISLVPDAPDIEATVKGSEMPDVEIIFVSPSRFRSLISISLMHNFAGYLSAALLIIVAFLSLLFRDWKKVAYGLVPVITGIAFMTGVMGLLGIRFNVFNVVAAILVVGLGVDFGIFMVYKGSEGYDYDTDKSVLLGGLTTVTGIGALVLAQHPALRSIGTTVLIGLAGAIPSALLVIPALQSFERGKV